MNSDEFKKLAEEVNKEIDNLPEGFDRKDGNALHDHFLKIKQENPERFKGLFFFPHAGSPFSDDLAKIIFQRNLDEIPLPT
jgi:hypothetical protein